jgi:hypothetical protein
LIETVARFDELRLTAGQLVARILGLLEAFVSAAAAIAGLSRFDTGRECNRGESADRGSHAP